MDKTEKVLRGLHRLPANKRCFNCNNLGTTYVVPQFQIFVCTECSGIHMRSNQRVKSISMAKFSAEEVGFLEDMGNEGAANVYLAKWHPERDLRRPTDKNPGRVKQWIATVFIEKLFYDAGGLSDFKTRQSAPSPPMTKLEVRKPLTPTPSPQPAKSSPSPEPEVKKAIVSILDMDAQIVPSSAKPGAVSAGFEEPWDAFGSGAAGTRSDAAPQPSRNTFQAQVANAEADWAAWDNAPATADASLKATSAPAEVVETNATRSDGVSLGPTTSSSQLARASSSDATRSAFSATAMQQQRLRELSSELFANPPTGPLHRPHPPFARPPTAPGMLPQMVMLPNGMMMMAQPGAQHLMPMPGMAALPPRGPPNMNGNGMPGGIGPRPGGAHMLPPGYGVPPGAGFAANGVAYPMGVPFDASGLQQPPPGMASEPSPQSASDLAFSDLVVDLRKSLPRKPEQGYGAPYYASPFDTFEPTKRPSAAGNSFANEPRTESNANVPSGGNPFA